MGKSVGDLLADIDENGISADYTIYALYVELNSDGDVIGQKSPVSIERIEIDNSSCELLLHKNEGGDPALVELLQAAAIDEVLKYDVCVAVEYIDGDTTIRIDSPLVGTGENHSEARFFAICQVSD